MADRRLYASSAASVEPWAQSLAERELLDAAAGGELRLHASTLRGEVLSIGAHAAEPGAARPTAGAEDGRTWRRRTGGRPVACGEGFALLTLALPHRAALLGPSGSALAPEQVMNRAVRGLLAMLRGAGLEPIYPGLDTVTVGGRIVAHTSFAETAAGSVLFQAILGCRRSIAESTRLLDRLDPQGRIATPPVAETAATSLAALADMARGRGSSAAAALDDLAAADPARLAVHAAAAWADVFGLEVASPSTATTGSLDRVPPPFEPGEYDMFAPAHGAASASVVGRLGIVTAWVLARDARIAAAGLGGDLIAPEGATRRIAAALEGLPLDGPAIVAGLDRVLDRDRNWVLGPTPGELAHLFARAAAEAA